MTVARSERRDATDRRKGNRIKTALRPFEIKSADVKERTFEGLAAAWSLDLGGDIIHPGAFTKTLGYWREKGFSIPLLNQHSYYNGIHDVLGSMIEADESDAGLWAKFEVDDGDDGNKLLRHIEHKRLNGLSIGYEAVEAEQDKDGIRHLRELKLMEVSAVIWPMNQDAVIDPTSVKSLLMAVKAAADVDEAVKKLKQAIALHEKHMDGTAPTAGPEGERSQMKMMKMMKAALEALTGEPIDDMDTMKSRIHVFSNDSIREMREALDAEATARAEKANPTLPQEKADELRDRLRSIRLRPLLSRTSGQNTAQLTPDNGKHNDTERQGTGAR